MKVGCQNSIDLVEQGFRAVEAILCEVDSSAGSIGRRGAGIAGTFLGVEENIGLKEKGEVNEGRQREERWSGGEVHDESMREVEAIGVGSKPEIEQRAIHEGHDRAGSVFIGEEKKAAMRRVAQNAIFAIEGDVTDGFRPVIGGFLVEDKMLGGLMQQDRGDRVAISLLSYFLQDRGVNRRGEFGDRAGAWISLGTEGIGGCEGEEIDEVGALGGVPALEAGDERCGRGD